MAKLTRLILYTPDGKRTAMLADHAEYDGKLLSYTDRRTNIATKTNLPFVLQEVEETGIADVPYP
jgi:hypothetical protein